MTSNGDEVSQNKWPIKTTALVDIMKTDNIDNSDHNKTTNDERQRLWPNKVKDNSRFGWKPYKGILLAMLSTLFFSLQSLIVQTLDKLSPGELSLVRFGFIVVLSLPNLLIKHRSEPFGPKELRPWIGLRGLLESLSLVLNYTAFQYMPIGDAMVIIFSLPMVFVSIFATCCLKERCGAMQSMTIVITIIGLLLTTKRAIVLSSENLFRPEPIANGTLVSESAQDVQRVHYVYGVLAGLASTIFLTFVFICIRKAKEVPHTIVLFNSSWVAFALTAIITAICDGYSLPTTTIEWLLCLVLGILSFCGQTLLTMSLQCEEAGPVSVVRGANDIIWAFIFQITLLHQVPDGWSIAGALLVTASIVIMGVRKWIQTLPDDSRTKSKLWFLLI